MTADSLPPRTGELLGVGPKAAAEVGLISDLIGRAQSSSVPTGRADAPDLYAVERAFGRHLVDKRARSGVATARDRALDLAKAAGEVSGSLAISFASDVFVSLAIERPWRERDADVVLTTLSTILGTSSRSLAVELLVTSLRAPQLLELPPTVALEVQISMLHALTPVVEASLWAKDDAGRPQCIVAFGRTAATRRFRAIAARALDGEPADSGERGTIVAAPVRRWQRPAAALVARMRTRDGASILSETADAMGPLLEREFLLQRAAARENSLVRATERRLGRLGLDLHDGALQHVAAFAADLRVARRELGEMSPSTTQPHAASRINDLETRVWELDRVLRELAHSLEPASLLRRPLADVISSEASAFAERTGIETRHLVKGEFGAMTASQKIALIRIVQEALTNIREHANASSVEISISATRASVDARIEDDGAGFDVARTLLDAAKRGRLGLVGSSERVRLLGGTLDVSSRLGGPSVVAFSLPRWQPLFAAGDEAPAVELLAT